jgi:DNA-binding protein
MEPAESVTKQFAAESTAELGFQEASAAGERGGDAYAARLNEREAARAETDRSERRASRDEGTIFVGKKPLMTYVLAVVTQFNAGAASVKIKGRGKAISRVVDVTQVVKNRFMNSMRIANFEAATEMLPNEDGTTSKVSSLTLTLSK